MWVWLSFLARRHRLFQTHLSPAASSRLPCTSSKTLPNTLDTKRSKFPTKPVTTALVHWSVISLCLVPQSNVGRLSSSRSTKQYSSSRGSLGTRVAPRDSCLQDRCDVNNNKSVHQGSRKRADIPFSQVLWQQWQHRRQDIDGYRYPQCGRFYVSRQFLVRLHIIGAGFACPFDRHAEHYWEGGPWGTLRRRSQLLIRNTRQSEPTESGKIFYVKSPDRFPFHDLIAVNEKIRIKKKEHDQENLGCSARKWSPFDVK